LIIDFHNHYLPKAYLEYLKKEKGAFAKLSTDSQGRFIQEYTNDYNIIVGPHTDLEQRLKAMDRASVDMEVLTLMSPGVERAPAEDGVRLARLANDEFGQIKEKYPDRFTALAALPYQEPQAAVKELERAVKECGLSGVMLFSNINRRPLDSKEYMPIYETAAKLDAPLFMHPSVAINLSAMDEYRLTPILGFTVDTSLATLRLVFSGILKRLPNLKLVIAHLGGVFPYLRGRVETAYNSYPECKVNISEPPSTYLKKIWVDSICYDADVLMSTYAFSGADKIVLGTDFPHQIHDLDHAVERIKSLKINEDEKEKILGENAVKLLKL
jgi:aminocarboxymuconate-semialdehyde decarboxylase